MSWYQVIKLAAKISPDQAIDIMGFSNIPTEAELRNKYRELAKKHHPDAGGDNDQFVLIN